MHALTLFLGLSFCVLVIVDAFETIILPRRPKGRFRLTRLYYISTWRPWAAIAGKFIPVKSREQFYSIFGPLSLLCLFLLWATLLVGGFAFILFGLGTPYQDASLAPGTHPVASLRTDLYVSGTTLTTLGPGDVVPRRQAARLLMVAESGTGLAFVALVISYVPVIYGAFSRREVSVALLDARAGSPPSAAELLARHSFHGGEAALISLLAEWERWSAEILESHISYPILCYYRSQHDNQSWLAALTAILDTCALLITTVEGPSSRQAQLTFAIARHAVVDLCHVFNLDRAASLLEKDPKRDRLPPESFGRLCSVITAAGIRLCSGQHTAERLAAIRRLYEPQVGALSNYICLPLPVWISDPKPTDQWRKVASLRPDHLESVLAGSGHLSPQSATYVADLEDQSR